MTKQQKQKYEDTEVLRKIIQDLKGKKYRLDCGHNITFGYFLGNDIFIQNSKNPVIICSQCGY